MKATRIERLTAKPAAMPTPRQLRDASIDAMRGLAIFIMIGANMGPMLLEPHSFAYRFYCTLAAPIFILIAGLMVGRAQMLKLPERNFRYYAQRCVFLMSVGAFVDIAAWNILPFMTMDVLYLIGLMLPLAYCASRMRTPHLVWLIVAILLLTPFLQQFLGYTAYPREYRLNGVIVDNGAPFSTSVLNHWLVDGWFPLFPWAGYLLVGLLLARKRWNGRVISRFTARRYWQIGLLLCVFGLALMMLLPQEYISRRGYSELFYPPSLGLISLTLGMTLLLFVLVDSTRNFVGWQILRCLGEAPLFMYVLHVLIIGRIFMHLFPRIDTDTLIAVYVCFSLWLICMGWVLRLCKRSLNSARSVRWLMGGRLLEV